MKQFLIPLLLGALPVVGRAQVPPATPLPPDTARVFKHELGLTASPQLDHFLTANRALPVGLLYKRHLNARSALRLRVVGQYEGSRKVDDDTFAHPEGTLRRAWEAQVFGGWEMQRPLAPRWAAGYGAELGLALMRERVENHYRDTGINDGNTTFFNKGTILTQTRASVQTRLFGRLAFRVWRSGQLFAETALVGVYYRERYKPEEFYDVPPPLFAPPYGSTTRGFTVLLRPVQFIGISASF